MSAQADIALLKLMGGNAGSRVDSLIRSGVPLSALDKLSERGINPVSIGIINARTLRHRRSRQEPLTPDEGDKFYRASRAVLLAEEVFGSREKALQWLTKPRKALAGMTALEAANTTPGYSEVEEMLEQIRNGFFA